MMLFSFDNPSIIQSVAPQGRICSLWPWKTSPFGPARSVLTSLGWPNHPFPSLRLSPRRGALFSVFRSLFSLFPAHRLSS